MGGLPRADWITRPHDRRNASRGELTLTGTAGTVFTASDPSPAGTRAVLIRHNRKTGDVIERQRRSRPLIQVKRPPVRQAPGLPQQRSVTEMKPVLAGVS